MADRGLSIGATAQTHDHAALAAWHRLMGTDSSATRVQVLKDVEKTSAYRLGGCGPDGGDVVAIRRSTVSTLVERAVYERVLPHTGVPKLRLHGVIDDGDGSAWLFLDDAGEDVPDFRRYADRVAAGEWLARLHVDLAGLGRPEGLPDRDLADARRELRSSRVALVAATHLPELDTEGRRLVDDIVRRLDVLDTGWDRIIDAVGDLPSTLVHADLAPKNIRYRKASQERSLLAFDWDMAGWGLPLRDLALIDLGAYLRVARPIWRGRAHELDRLADIGRLLGLIGAIGWEMPRLHQGGLLRALTRLAAHHERLGSVATLVLLVPSGASGGQRSSAGERQDPGVAARSLRAMDPHECARIVEVLDAVPNTYQSTFPSHILLCRFDDGLERRVFVKRYVPGLHAGGSFWAGGPYEARMYRDILAACDLGTPEYFGSWSDPGTGDTFIAIEYVEGWRLNRSEPARLVDAARWLARLHCELTAVSLRHPSVRVYNAAYFRDCSHQALTTVRASGADAGWLERLVRCFDDVMILRLTGADQSFIHGEPYPENVIVSEGRIRTVDWQSAAIGPGAVDLACLTEGRWPASLVAESEAAYVAERWPGEVPAAFRGELEAARLYWAMRWLAQDPDPSTSADRAAYIETLRRSAERLGLASRPHD